MANTYRMANLRGFSDSTGNRKKQSMKHTAAPRMHAMNMSIRSHRLTIEKMVSNFSYRLFLSFPFLYDSNPTQEQSDSPSPFTCTRLCSQYE